MNSLTPTQKQIVALLIIVPCSIIQLFIIIAVGLLLTGQAERTLTDMLSFLFVLALTAFPVMYAVRLWREAKRQRQFVHVLVDSDTSIRFTTYVSLEDYRKLILHISFTHPMILFIYILAAVILLGFLLNPGTDLFSWWPIFIIIFTIYLPFSIYRTANSNYKATKALHEKASYEFTPSLVTVTGESYSTTMQWQTFHKVLEKKDWFLLYCNKQTALLIPKNVFSSAAELNTFRNLAFSLINIGKQTS